MISAMEDVVELRDGIATFDAYWHNARKKILHMIVPVSRKFVDCRCCEGPTSTDFAGYNPRIYKQNSWLTSRKKVECPHACDI